MDSSDESDDQPFEQRIAAANTTVNGDRVAKRRKRVASENDDAKAELRKLKKKKKKDRPEELSSKIPLNRDRLVREKDPKQKKVRDPRFDDLSGQYRANDFKGSYKFLTKYRQSEAEALKTKLKFAVAEDEKKEIQRELTKTQQIIKKTQEEKAKTEAKREFLQEERTLVRKGKKPFYLKKAKEKEIELAVKYKELKETGKLDTYMAKKRKHRASKEHKYMPWERSSK